MMRLMLICVLSAYLSGCAVFWQTMAGTIIGNLGAEAVKNELDKAEKDEAPRS